MTSSCHNLNLIIILIPINKSWGSFASILFQNDNKIVLGGGLFDSGSKMFAVRLYESGSIDSAFCNNAFGNNALYERAGDGISEMSYQPDGKILITGRAGDYLVQLRILPTGENDLFFESTNMMSHPITGRGKNVIMYPDGRILYGGNTLNNAVLYRYDKENNVAITDITNNELITIFPNPVKDVLFIKSIDSYISGLQIADEMGRIVIKYDKKFKTKSVNITKLSSGMYYLHIYKENGEKFTKKIVVY